MAKARNKYARVRKTKQLAEVFKRKSGPINRRKSRTTEKQEWRKEVEDA